MGLRTDPIMTSPLPDEQRSKNGIGLPLLGLAAGLVATGAAGIYLGASLLAPPSTVRFFPGASARASAELAHLAATLTESPRLAVRANNSGMRESTITQYNAAADSLLRALEALRGGNKAAAGTTPIAKAAAEALTAARQRVNAERKALRLLQQGQTTEARKILDGTAYAASVRAFGDAREQLDAELAKRALWAGALAFAGALGGLALLGYGIVGTTRRWHSHHRRTAADIAERDRRREEAEAARATLQSRVEEHQEELANARTALEEQVQRGRRADTRASRLASAVESTNDVVMICEGGVFGNPLRLLYVNLAFERMTGYTRDELAEGTPKMLQGVRTDAATLEHMRNKLRAVEPVQVELLNYKKDGTEFWVELNIQPLYDSNGIPNGWMSIQRDITERKLADERIQHQATHDALTDLPNRVLYERRLQDALHSVEHKGGMVGVLFFDLDRFKQINDTLGHPAGDKLLQEVAVRLQTCLRPQDTVARMGGDEFTILMPELEAPEDTEETARRVLSTLEEPFLVEGQELFVTASMGISIAPRDGSDIITLLKNADTAMYRAKDHGRDTFRTYTRTMNETARDRIELEAHLRRALERDELFLLYQPQVSLVDGLVYGVETLVRWESPVLGRVSPAQFVPLAEETGLIVSIGDFVLRESCRQAARWVESGRPLRVAVNLAARQFEQPDLVDQVWQILEETGLPPEWLDLELTERLLVQGDRTADTLQALKALGVRLSVDDFGTGYSSLSYLRTFPLDILKIDQSFVRSMNDDRRSEAVVRALIELGHAVNLEVIAEGVETDPQRQTLATLGCDAMQGYLFSPATKPQEVERLADAAAEANRTNPARHLRLVS